MFPSDPSGGSGAVLSHKNSLGRRGGPSPTPPTSSNSRESPRSPTTTAPAGPLSQEGSYRVAHQGYVDVLTFDSQTMKSHWLPHFMVLFERRIQFFSLAGSAPYDQAVDVFSLTSRTIVSTQALSSRNGTPSPGGGLSEYKVIVLNPCEPGQSPRMIRVRNKADSPVGSTTPSSAPGSEQQASEDSHAVWLNKLQAAVREARRSFDDDRTYGVDFASESAAGRGAPSLPSLKISNARTSSLQTVDSKAQTPVTGYLGAGGFFDGATTPVLRPVTPVSGQLFFGSSQNEPSTPPNQKNNPTASSGGGGVTRTQTQSSHYQSSEPSTTPLLKPQTITPGPATRKGSQGSFNFTLTPTQDPPTPSLRPEKSFQSFSDGLSNQSPVGASPSTPTTQKAQTPTLGTKWFTFGSPVAARSATVSSFSSVPSRQATLTGTGPQSTNGGSSARPFRSRKLSEASIGAVEVSQPLNFAAEIRVGRSTTVTSAASAADEDGHHRSSPNHHQQQQQQQQQQPHALQRHQNERHYHRRRARSASPTAIALAAAMATADSTDLTAVAKYPFASGDFSAPPVIRVSSTASSSGSAAVPARSARSLDEPRPAGIALQRRPPAPPALPAGLANAAATTATAPLHREYASNPAAGGGGSGGSGGGMLYSWQVPPPALPPPSGPLPPLPPSAAVAAAAAGPAAASAAESSRSTTPTQMVAVLAPTPTPMPMPPAAAGAAGLLDPADPLLLLLREQQYHLQRMTALFQETQAQVMQRLTARNGGGGGGSYGPGEKQYSPPAGRGGGGGGNDWYFPALQDSPSSAGAGTGGGGGGGGSRPGTPGFPHAPEGATAWSTAPAAAAPILLEMETTRAPIAAPSASAAAASGVGGAVAKDPRHQDGGSVWQAF
ncbi:hypothetical protein DFJ73DRAFT_756943 [Zopfochytrium polystomum]|nr:hypothetical protein DFJ73DRAFT_756943 [Zopfochytrium polystomum]